MTSRDPSAVDVKSSQSSPVMDGRQSGAGSMLWGSAGSELSAHPPVPVHHSFTEGLPPEASGVVKIPQCRHSSSAESVDYEDGEEQRIRWFWRRDRSLGVSVAHLA